MGDGDHSFSPWILFTLLFMLILSFSGCLTLTNSSIPSSSLTRGWHENTALRNTGSQMFGLTQWQSTTYEILGNYPASLTITTMKTLVQSEKEQLQKDVIHTIETTFTTQIVLTQNSQGERLLRNGHTSHYILYTGRDLRTNDTVRIVGEVWNCDRSGTSILCIGLAYITSNKIPGTINTEQWQKIIGDTQGTLEGMIDDTGLLFCVRCH